MVQKGKGLRFMPKAYIEKLKQIPVVIGHERCASSNFSDSGTLVVCAEHGYGYARVVLHKGLYYNGCRECITMYCKVSSARTEEKPRSIYVDIGEPKP